MTAASDLASDLVQECLGFTSQSSKLNALHQVQTFLSLCIDSSESGSHQEWREFLEGSDDDDDDDGEGSDFLLRDSFLKSLMECCCHPNNTNNSNNDDDCDLAGGNNKDNEKTSCLEVIESSLQCLTLLIRLRCTAAAAFSSVKSDPIFGPDFVSTIASSVVQALKMEKDDNDELSLSGSGGGVAYAASQLLIALLRIDRPRNEMCIPTINELILLPASSSSSSTTGSSSSSSAAVACIAEVLCTSILTAVNISVPKTTASIMDEEELSMRRETAVLQRLQDMREVMMNVGMACANGLLLANTNNTNTNHEKNDSSIANNGSSSSSERIVTAIQQIYDIAAFAVESQLETLLDDQKAALIIAELSKNTVAATNNNSSSNNNPTMMMDEDEDDYMDIDLKEAKSLEEACTLPPLYANIAKPPAILTTTKSLDAMLLTINDSLNATNAECWDERLNALINLECILAGGVVSSSLPHEARHLFIDKVRKMPLPEQFADLRSQITQQACKVIVATVYEYRAVVLDDGQLNQAVSHLVERTIPAILNLCKSGTRLMASQGMACLTHLVSVCGSVGYSRTVPRFCDDILGKKVHTNRKRGSVMALTAALRVWDGSCFTKHSIVDQLTMAVKEGATNRDPAVREEGRKFYWAMVACCDETRRAVEGMFDGRSREMKNLKKEQEGIDAEWEEGGVMDVLVQTGVPGEAPPPPEKTKKATGTKSRRIPPRNTIKRPASSRLRAEHGTPFKAHRASTPMKSASAVTTSKLPPSSAKSSKQPSSTPAVKKSTSPMRMSERKRPTSPMRTSEKKSINRNHITSSSSKVCRTTRPSTAPTKGSEDVKGKENATIMQTPAKSVGFNVNMLNPSTPTVIMGTPVVNLLARASPLSAEKIRNTGDVLGECISLLSDTRSPHEQSLGIKALALFAKEEPNHYSWEEKFPAVLTCLLDHIKNMPSADFNGPVDFIRSPTKNLSSCHQMQHLFLQSVRSLLQFVPGYVKADQVKDIVCSMLECTEDAPFEIVHTAERALDNLVAGTNAQLCFENLLPFTSVEIDLDDKSNPPALLSALRTMKHLVDKIPIDTLKRATPSLLPLLHSTLSHKSMDMRKATVFILVEMHFVLENELSFEELADSQRRLIDVYIERHPKNTQMAMEAVPQQQPIIA